MITIKVPATLGNFGPGIGSIGIALDWYLTVEVMGASEQWIVHHNLGDDVPTDDTNYLVAVAKKLSPTLTPHELRITSAIPRQQGLGSSKAALIAAIELANQLGELDLDDYTKLTLAARTAGQPANVTAALLGGVTTSYLSAGQVFASGVVAPAYQAVVYLAEPRTAVVEPPASIDYQTAVATAAAGNMLLAAWQSQQILLAGQLLETPGLNGHTESAALAKIRQASHALDIYGTVVADRGPAIVTLVPSAQVTDFLDVVAHLSLPGEFKVVDIAMNGLQVI